MTVQEALKHLREVAKPELFQELALSRITLDRMIDGQLKVDREMLWNFAAIAHRRNLTSERAAFADAYLKTFEDAYRGAIDLVAKSFGVSSEGLREIPQ